VVARKAASASTCYTALTRNRVVTDEGNAVGETRALFAAVATCMSKYNEDLHSPKRQGSSRKVHELYIAI